MVLSTYFILFIFFRYTYRYSYFDFIFLYVNGTNIIVLFLNCIKNTLYFILELKLCNILYKYFIILYHIKIRFHWSYRNFFASYSHIVQWN